MPVRPLIVVSLVFFLAFAHVFAQEAIQGKRFSPMLFGLFFEDINYAANGGLYAEHVQNRSFEYSPSDHKEWNSFSCWEYTTPGFSYGSLSIETTNPINPNNQHYAVLDVEHVGNEKQFTEHKTPPNSLTVIRIKTG